MIDWKTLGKVPPGELATARVQLHFAVQNVAAAGASLALPKADSSHKSFTYDPDRSAVTGVLIDGVRPFRVALVLPRLTLMLVAKGGDVIDELALSGRTDDDALRWLGHHADMLLGGDRAIQPHRYDSDFPAHPVGEGAPYSIEDGDPRLVEIDTYFANARRLLEIVTTAGDRGPMVIWPHHFDLAALIPVETSDQGATKTVGVGLSPGDTQSPEPYWYVSAWPPPDADRLPTVDGPGTWQVTPWFGATLSATAMLAAAGDQCDAVTAFVERAIDTSRELLRAP